MNTKKNKSKNRTKPPKTTQDVSTEVNIENVVVIDEGDKSEIVKEANIESIESISEPIGEEEKMVSDMPKKPKRKKVKKKQEIWIEEKDSTATDEVNKETTIKIQDSENIENKTEELSTLIPTTRKKKNKGIKSVDQNKMVEQAEIITENQDKTTDDKNQKADRVNMEIIESKTPELEGKDVAGPKKKKKKKNRSDSEKSDINDACTLAFQKLLKASDIDTEKIETDVAISELEFDNNLKDTALTDTKDPQDSASECLKSKRKNKKGKKSHGCDSNVKTLNEEFQMSKPNISLTETPQIENIIKELSPKPKAKIAKPVQKKGKGKSDSKEVASILPPDSENDKKERTSSPIATTKNQTEEDIKINLDSTTSPIATLSSETPSIIQKTCIGTEPKDIVQCEQKDLKGQTSSEKKDDCTVSLDIKKTAEEQTADVTKQSDDSGFIEVKSSKNKKKRLQSAEELSEVAGIIELEKPQDEVEHENKPSSHEAKCETFYDVPQLDIKENVKPEELEGLKVATPDLIQYPRSTSQLNIDDNNNTVIQEITTPDEVKLGIPICTPPPIVQGSGESPDTKSINDSIKIKISKCEPQYVKDSNEKTDIKSKMFEVNKEMEELRRSIERSLAELTGSEKCDSEVDKEFEAIFQSQSTELPSTASTENKSNDSCFTVDTKKQDEKILEKEVENKIVEDQKTSTEDTFKTETVKCDTKNDVPVCPARSKSKGKSKKKGKKELVGPSGDTTSSTSTSSTSVPQEKTGGEKESKGSEKSEEKSGSGQEKGKQQSSNVQESEETIHGLKLDLSFEPIENFEDALTSSVDDVNKTFEIIANDATESIHYQNNPQINVIAPSEDAEDGTKTDQKQESPISQPKNLLGRPNIPASSNKTDYKKEKSKPPSSIQAKVKIKDAVDIEKAHNQAKVSELDKKLIKERNGHNYFTMSNANEEFIYKYNFRKVFLQSVCHVCKKNLVQRVPCKFCNLVFYCNEKHKDEDWSRHQSLCFAVSTIAHLKEQKHIYADAQNITGHDYRVLRMQMILSCEKILKRKLVPWEQEAMLYPRICADASCREWKQSRLKDCEGCAQISYCAEHPNHLSSNHQRWCKSYALYQKLVIHQQTKGRLEPKLPSKILSHFRIPDNLNQVLGSMYEEKIDMDDIQYAALTQIATGPLTAAHAYQLYNNKSNTINGTSKKSSITIHLIATDLQYEADVLNKWEIFFLHLYDVSDLRVVLVGNDLNPSNLPLDLLAKIRLCDNCRANKRRVIFDFHDKESYEEYYSSSDFITPDIVCAFNPNIHRSSTLKTENNWPSTLNCILKQRVPFLLTSYTINELKRDIKQIKQTNKDYITISDIKHNPFTSVRPDRNFITDHEMPLLFKNYCYTVVCGV